MDDNPSSDGNEGFLRLSWFVAIKEGLIGGNDGSRRNETGAATVWANSILLVVDVGEVLAASTVQGMRHKPITTRLMGLI